MESVVLPRVTGESDHPVDGLDDQDIETLVALARAPQLRAAQIDRLLKSADRPTGRPARLNTTDLAPATVAWLANPDPECVRRDLEWLRKPGCQLLAYGQSQYPMLLAQLKDPPPVLWLRGDADLLSWPQIAIVGSRNPSAAGAETAFQFARYLAGMGLCITSGLAIGIDAQAHHGALSAEGASVAVFGSGLDTLYPKANRSLADQLASQGLLISEYPPETPPRRANFPNRNRIIAGLSLATLVVEAAQRSGSLITARLAAEQGREVFAIPGSIHNPMTRGCHRLIKEGAKLVETADDILSELPAISGLAPSPSPDSAAPRQSAGQTALEADGDYRMLLDALGFEPADMDTLVLRTGLTPEELSSMLLILELRGAVESQPGGVYLSKHVRGEE